MAKQCLCGRPKITAHRTMKVIDLGPDMQPYRYRVSVDYHNLTPIDQVRVWADQQDIQCTILPGLAFFHHEEDVVLFLLRWT